MSKKSRFEIPFPILRVVAKTFLKLGFGLEVRGLEHLQGVTQVQRQACSGGLILAGNHGGYMDCLAVVAGCGRPFRFLMTHEVFSWPWVGRLVPFANIIPLYAGRQKRALVDSVRLLEQSGAVCIFPEGKLSHDGELDEFNTGVAYLQQKSGAPIVPFAISGSFQAWGFQRQPAIGNKVTITFGEPIWPGELRDACDGETDREALTAEVKQRVQALLMENETAATTPATRLGGRLPSY